MMVEFRKFPFEALDQAGRSDPGFWLMWLTSELEKYFLRQNFKKVFPRVFQTRSKAFETGLIVPELNGKYKIQFVYDGRISKISTFGALASGWRLGSWILACVIDFRARKIFFETNFQKSVS